MTLRQTAARTFVALALAASCAGAALADTIRLRDGSVVRGQIIAYKDQQFTVLIGGNARGRRGRMTIYMEDVESIEFDLAAGGDAGADSGRPGRDEATYDVDDNNRPAPRPTPTPTQSRPAPQISRPPQPQSDGVGPDRTQGSGPASSAPVFVPVRLRVDPRSTESGWVSSGFSVRRGQRLRVTASGRVTLSNGMTTTPTGLPRVADADKLMANEPTGALIAVIGDDNNDFIILSSQREFVAPRDGILFFGVNTGRLTSTAGAFDVTLEAETPAR